MDEPRWLKAKTVLAIHQRQIAEHGGMAGVRDAGLLESALARPRNLLAYGQPTPDLPAQAASYAYGLIRNHPFADGNKRTAYVVCRTFLKLNGVDISASDVDKYQTFIAVADGSLPEEQLAEWIRSHAI
jgi:death-on-curing protein